MSEPQINSKYIEGAARTTAGIYKINQQILAGVKLPIPPLSEQRRIVECLDDHLSRLDAAGNSLSHAASLFAPQTRSLYTAATEGRSSRPSIEPVPNFRATRQDVWQSGNEGKKYRSPAIPDVSTRPVIPNEWGLFSLEELTDPIRIIRYGILMPKVKSEGIVPHVEVKDLAGCTLQGKRLHLTSAELDEKFSGSRILPGDVLLAVRGSYDRSSVVPKSLAGANVSRDVARIAPLSGIESEYLQIYLQSRFAQQYLKNHARGVAVKGVNIAAVRAMPVAVPPLSTQREIIEEVHQRKTEVDPVFAAVGRSVQRGMMLRRAVLVQAFSGRLVAQNPMDEPVSVTLQRTGSEHRRIQCEGAGEPARVHRPRKLSQRSSSDSTSNPKNNVQQEFEL
ncbi:restriction endonuclease subunit S [Streptomyces rubiginosohelvolus]|uniref:restriction endonuclease subunit S n=1 Tax=Streptomyces rubiginosohelvolus TaxID=67362 RepID=UPI00368E20AB